MLAVISESVVLEETIVLWIKNLSLHSISGRAVRWACIVTTLTKESNSYNKSTCRRKQSESTMQKKTNPIAL